MLINEVADIDVDSALVNAKQVTAAHTHTQVHVLYHTCTQECMQACCACIRIKSSRIQRGRGSCSSCRDALLRLAHTPCTHAMHTRRSQRNAAVGVRAAELAGGCACCAVAGAFGDALAALTASPSYHDLDYLVRHSLVRICCGRDL